MALSKVKQKEIIDSVKFIKKNIILRKDLGEQIDKLKAEDEKKTDEYFKTIDRLKIEMADETEICIRIADEFFHLKQHSAGVYIEQFYIEAETNVK